MSQVRVSRQAKPVSPQRQFVSEADFPAASGRVESAAMGHLPRQKHWGAPDTPLRQAGVVILAIGFKDRCKVLTRSSLRP